MKALVFVARPPWPTWCGMDVRASELVRSLTTVCSTVTLASLKAPEAPPPPDVSVGLACFDQDGKSEVFRRTSWIEPDYPKEGWLWSSADGHVTDWFRSTVERERPDLLVIHQSRYAWLLPPTWQLGDTRTLIDAPELQSANDRLWGELVAAIGPFPVDVAAIPDHVLDDLPLTAPGWIDVDESEIDGFRRFDRVLLMNRAEAAHVTRQVGAGRARWVPQTVQATSRKTSNDGPAVCVMAANPHNVAGFAWFLRRVLPAVRASAPDFELVVAGDGSRCIDALDVAGMHLVGRLEDLGSLYADARLAICPVFTGTGQPVKILEALAHQVPVVAVEPSATRAGVPPGKGVVVGHDAESFASSVVALWRDRRVAQQLGVAGADWVSDAHQANPLREVVRDLAPRLGVS